MTKPKQTPIEGELEQVDNFVYMLENVNGQKLNKFSFLVKGENGLATKEEEQEMADHILKAVNSHNELVEALKEIIDNCPNPKLAYGKEIVAIAKQALKKVEG